MLCGPVPRLVPNSRTASTFQGDESDRARVQSGLERIGATGFEPATARPPDRLACARGTTAGIATIATDSLPSPERLKARSASGLRESGRLDSNQRPLGPQPTGGWCRCVPERPPRPLRPLPWTRWTHRTQQSVPKWYHSSPALRVSLRMEGSTSRPASPEGRIVSDRRRTPAPAGVSLGERRNGCRDAGTRL